MTLVDQYRVLLMPGGWICATRGDDIRQGAYFCLTEALRRDIYRWMKTAAGKSWVAAQRERLERLERERPADVERLRKPVDLKLFEREAA